jgi:hypothetical protein
MSKSKQELRSKIIALFAESGFTYQEARKTLVDIAQSLEPLAMGRQMEDQTD